MALGGLRGRIALIFLLLLFATGAGLHQLLVRVTREWLVVELGSRGRAISMQLAERSLTPLLVGDRARLRREFARPRMTWISSASPRTTARAACS